MATKTAGTNATTTLTALQFQPGLGSGMSAADIATMNQLILNDANRLLAPVGGSFDSSGILTLPNNRGTVKMYPGDWLCIDSRGWPIIVSKDAMTSGPWTHT